MVPGRVMAKRRGFLSAHGQDKESVRDAPYQRIPHTTCETILNTKVTQYGITNKGAMAPCVVVLHSPRAPAQGTVQAPCVSKLAFKKTRAALWAALCILRQAGIQPWQTYCIECNDPNPTATQVARSPQSEWGLIFHFLLIPAWGVQSSALHTCLQAGA